MKKLKTTNCFKDIVLNDVKLIDVRAPIEYEKGSIINSVNMPILSNDERCLVGTCYKENGNEEATKLGHSLVSGKIKEERVAEWIKYFNENPEAMIYCFRGGSRSSIAQQWIYEATGREIVKLEGGYKAFRNYLIDALNPENIKSIPLVITGFTGSGKTIILNKLKNAIDLEGIANHRGSTFGHHVTPQPTQINFENDLASRVIKHESKGFKYMVFEDESKNIGRSFIPKEFFMNFQKGDTIFLEASMEERIENILQEYVVSDQQEYISKVDDKELALKLWLEDMICSIERVKKRIGGDNTKSLIEKVTSAYDYQLKTNNVDYHREWISIFLSKYYDPMYNHCLERSDKKIVFRGNAKEVLNYINSLEQ